MLSSGLHKAMKALWHGEKSLECRREGPSTASKACVFLFLKSCLEPKKVVEESRFSAYIHGPSKAKECLQRLYWF